MLNGSLLYLAIFTVLNLLRHLNDSRKSLGGGGREQDILNLKKNFLNNIKFNELIESWIIFGRQDDTNFSYIKHMQCFNIMSKVRIKISNIGQNAWTSLIIHDR